MDNKIIFLSEMSFTGKIPADYNNMRTEFAWMHTLNAEHTNIFNYEKISGYDHVFIIFPKGKVFLCADGSKLINGINPYSKLLENNIVDKLKENNNKNIYYIQEGPHWWFNETEINDQFNFIRLLNAVDIIFAHNYSDLNFYSGWFPQKRVEVIPTLMLDNTIKDIKWNPQNKTIIGGNFSRWYGGIQSYRVAQEFENEIWTISSHSQRDQENQIADLNHLPRVYWTEWMKHLSTFKYAVHLMPTVAAGTFSLNCAYFGIPCIGNIKVDTQRLCHEDLSVDVDDIKKATELANELLTNKQFYDACSISARHNYETYFSVDVWKDKMSKILGINL